jgi:AAA+ superfamily predicted ATPase
MPDPASRADPRTPDWYPDWARRIAESYYAGSASLFVLHGNTFDETPLEEGDQPAYGPITTFLAEQLFGQWDLVLHYDVGRGIRPFAGRDLQRFRAMLGPTAQVFGTDLEKARVVEPQAVFAALDRFLVKQLHTPGEDRKRVALLVDQASFVFPAAEPGTLTLSSSAAAVTAINWAAAPQVRRIDFACILIDEQRANLQRRIMQNPHVMVQEIALPDEPARARFVRTVAAGRTPALTDGLTLDRYARETAGLSLNDLAPPLRAALEGQALDAKGFARLKKSLIERQCHGLLEFVEPKWGLDDVVGLEEAKRTLREDAALVVAGQRQFAPMGYLICGPVGTGKTFLVMAAAGEMGMPCVTLKNFRSKYVGETEANLEHVLAVLRAMGPVMVIIDEADAMLGDRDDGGDGGVSSRVFGMIAHQMGNSAYRGQIIWVLMTARPDLLPIDLKRQGRAEVHIPLFYPETGEELQGMIRAMARKIGLTLAADAVPDADSIPHTGALSGADIEGIMTRVARQAAIDGDGEISRARLAAGFADFVPSAQSLEKRLQLLAAVLECTDARFLPPAWRTMDRGAIQAELSAIRLQLGSS